MVEFAGRLCSEAHYEHSEIASRRHAVLLRRDRVKHSAVERRNKLEDCRKLMVFLQNCMEVCMYMCMQCRLDFKPGACTSLCSNFGRAPTSFSKR